jgi:hypothetical protein
VNAECDEHGALDEDLEADEHAAVRESQESQPSTNGPGVAPSGTRRLVLGDPLDGRAAEDRPESWGETSESESQRLARYRAQRPPHHGG